MISEVDIIITGEREIEKHLSQVVQKFNPNHGSDGRFSSGGGGGSMAADRGGAPGGSAIGSAFNVAKIAKTLSTPQKRMLSRLTGEFQDIHKMGKGLTFAIGLALEKKGLAMVKPHPSRNGQGPWWGIKHTKTGKLVRDHIELEMGEANA